MDEKDVALIKRQIADLRRSIHYNHVRFLVVGYTLMVVLAILPVIAMGLVLEFDRKLDYRMQALRGS